MTFSDLVYLGFLALISIPVAKMLWRAYGPKKSLHQTTPAPARPSAVGRVTSSLFGLDQPEPAAEPRTPRTAPLNPRSEPQKDIVQNVQRTNVQDEPADFEPPNADELWRLGAAIRHNAGGATKQQALEIAFDVKKGGSAGWRRASQLFDLASAPPPDPFPHLHAQQMPRWEPEPKKA